MIAKKKPKTTRKILGKGKYLRLVKCGHWEYAERPRSIRAAFIVAVTAKRRIILTKEYRVPVDKFVIGCPAGLIGDEVDHEAESLKSAVRRKLIEEAGFDAKKVTLLMDGPTSPGLTSEVISLVLAEDLKKVGKGGGIDNEKIEVFKVPLKKVDDWLVDRVREGCLIDPKVYAGLYFIRRRRKR